jgi:hypothetical protein
VEDEMVVYVARKGEVRSAYKILVGKLERPLGRSRRKWKDNIRKAHRAIGWEVVDWIHLSQDIDQWRILVKVGNFLTS